MLLCVHGVKSPQCQTLGAASCGIIWLLGLKLPAMPLPQVVAGAGMLLVAVGLPWYTQLALIAWSAEGRDELLPVAGQ